MSNVVIGGGIVGMVAALALKKKFPKDDVMLVERSGSLGGLLNGTTYKKNDLYFDLGTHIFQESGKKELDELLISSIPKEDLIFFETNSGDYAGGVFFNNFQQNTHFPDLRNLSDKTFRKQIDHHISKLTEIPKIDRLSPLLDVSSKRFGKKFSDEFIAPIMESMFKHKKDDLSAFALELTGLVRVVLDDFETWKDKIDNPIYKAIAGIPDQRLLSADLHHGRRSFYSKKNGSRCLVDGLEKKLIESGINIQKNSEIKILDKESLSLAISDEFGSSVNFNASSIVIATGVIGASFLLNFDIDDFPLDKPLSHSIINMELQNVTNSDLCYFYGFDQSSDWYRITNYKGFSGKDNDRRISIELLGDTANNLDKLQPVILDQLKDLGFIDSEAINFVDFVKLPAGYPSPTVNNMQSLCKIGQELSMDLPDNIILGGVGSSEGKFFQNEVVEDLFERIISWNF